MSDIHIDDFCRDAALILLQLYNAFPRKNAVYVEDISGYDEPDEVGLHSKRYQACFGTMLWLAEEGYLRYETLIYQDGIDQAVLTNKSFIMLSSLSNIQLAGINPDAPHSVKHEVQTVIHQLRSALSSGSSEYLRTIVRYLLSLEPQEYKAPDHIPYAPETCNENS